jgi:hypothetical protein
MKGAHLAGRTIVMALFVALAACGDATESLLGPPDEAAFSGGPHLAGQFAQASPEVMALPGTVFAARDQETGQLVFGVERPAVANDIAPIMARRGIPEAGYRVQLTEPIHFMSSLRDEHRPVVGGVQIHWSQYVCTLGFSVDHDGGRSFITNSHCTDSQGSTGDTQYNQPSRTVSPDPIGFEADDPAYFRGGVCSRGKVCRYSDAARALYEPGIESQARIAKTTGENNGSLEVAGHFSIASQDNTSTTFSGTIHKVGRTTGWSSGNVTNTCATVNVSGSSIQLLCQTLVQRSGTQIVGGGDSGSPVFTRGSNDNVQLIGILWGGSSSGDLFVFSPFSAVQDELGSMTATTDGVGGDGNGNGGDDDDNGDDDSSDGPNCPPNSNRPACR